VSFLYNFYEIFAFFLVDWMFIAALMEILFVAFPNYSDSANFYSFNFNNYFKSLFSVFVFFTTNNSPEIIIKFYPANSLITTSFITLVWVNNILLIGLLIGLTYYKMKIEMFDQIKEVQKVHVKNFVYERLTDYPNIKSVLIKRILNIYIENQHIDFIDIKKSIDEQLKYERKVTKASEEIFHNLKQSFEYELAFAIVNLIIVCLALYFISMKDFSKYQYFLIVIFLCCLSLLDAFNHLFFYDINDYDSMWKTIFDTVINIVVIGLSIALSLQKEPSSALIKLWAFLCLTKMFRVFLIYFKFDRHKLRRHILYPFFRQLYEISFQVFILFLVFASLGVNIFGGNINSYSLSIYNEAMGTDYEYETMNFNTILNSLTTFFIVMLNNNWPIIANISVISNSDNKRLMKFMFILFKFLINYIFINSLIAFIIQIFNEYENRQKIRMTQRLSELKGIDPSQVFYTENELSDIFDEDLSVEEDPQEES
jgi:hypothetical protein